MLVNDGKRSGIFSTESSLMPLSKKPKSDESDSLNNNASNETLSISRSRTSNLFAPIVTLAGHEGEVNCCEFSPCGEYLVSGSFDKNIRLWDVFKECENVAVLSGHKGSVMDVKFSVEGDALFSASADKMIGLWDFETGERIKRYRGHETFVNSLDVNRKGSQTLCSGSDDGTVRIWDRRRKEAVHKLDCNYQVLAVSFNVDGEFVFSSGIENLIRQWDLRKLAVVNQLKGHQDTVTGMSLSEDGNFLLSNAMDNTLRIWDTRPFTSGSERCTKILQGHAHTFEKNCLKCNWSMDGKRVSCGSGDRFVYVWDVASRQILYKLPGHTGSVNDVVFHPAEPIIASGSSDRKIFLGEIVPSF